MRLTPPTRMLALALGVLGCAAAPAQASWSTGGGGTAVAGASDLVAATISAPGTSSGATTLTWATEAQLVDDPGIGPVTYVVQRALGAGAYAAVASGPCSGTLTKPVTGCTDTVPADGSYSYRVIASLSTWTAASAPVSVVVNSPPTATITRKTATPTNATTLQWTVTFSENVTGVDATDFALATTGATSGAVLSSVAGSSKTWTVTAAAGTGDGTLGLDLVDDDSIIDATGNPLGAAGPGNGNVTGPAYTIDRTAPALVSLSMQDTDTNGKVNRVVATFNETLAATPATTLFTLANVPSGGTLTSISRSGATLTLTLLEGLGPADTAVGAFTLALAASASGARDAVGNQSSFPATAPTDAAKPVLLGVADTSGATDGLIEAGDTLTWTFSEALSAATVPAAPTVTETRPASGNVTLAIPGMLTAATSMGSTGYLNSAGKSAVFAGATSLSDASLTLTVGACSSGCTYPSAPVTPPTMSVTAATTLTDPAGNPTTKAYSLALTKVF